MVSFPCGHMWCAGCIDAAFEASYTGLWNIDTFPARSCCSQQPLGEMFEATILLPLTALFKCLEKHYQWLQIGATVDLEITAAVLAATEDFQKCGQCNNVVQRRDGCNHMK